MVRVVLLILGIVRLLLIEEVASGQADGKNETTTNSTRRILHRQLSDVSEYRYMVKIVYKDTCTGVIIASNWILTACHCITNVPCMYMSVYPAAWGSEEKINPFQCYPYPNYSSSYFEHDIGMIKVDKDLLEDSRAGTIGLPPPGKYYPPGTPATIAGWGKSENNVEPGLMHVEVELAVRDQCTARWTANNQNCELSNYCGDQALPLRLVCAVGTRSMPLGTCYGDPGSPIIVDKAVIGVFAFLISPDVKCGLDEPSAFISVVDYLPWIYSHIDPMKDTSTFSVEPEHLIPM